MMAKEKNADAYYWIDQGVVFINGKKYGADDPLPKLSKEQEERWLKQKRIGKKKEVVVIDTGEKVKLLTTEIDELKKELAERDAKIGELEKQVESLTAPNPDTGDGEK